MALSEEIKGISVKIGANTTELSTALKNINSEVKGTGQSLNEINKLLKFDPTNVELLTQKQKALTDQVEAAKQKVDALKQAQEQAAEMLANGQIDQGSYDKLSRDVIAAEQNLNRLSGQLDETNSQLDGTAESGGQAAAAVEEEGNAAETASKGNINLGAALGVATAAVAAATAAVIGLGKSFADSIAETAEYGDNIDKASQKIGMSAKAYQEWDAIAQHSGTSMDTLKTSFKTLATSAQSGKEEFKKLGLDLKEVAKMSQEDLFAKVIEGLQNMEEGTERTAIASKLLGKGALELGPLMNTSAEDTEKMRQAVNDLGGVMSDEAVKAAARYQDSLQDMNTAFDGLKRNLTSEFLPAMADCMDGLALIFSGQEGGTEMVTKGIQGIAEGINQIIPTILPLIMSVISQIALVLAQNIPTLISSIKTIMPQIVQVIQELAAALIQNLPLLIECGLELIKALAQAILDNLPLIIQSAIDILMSLLQGISENIDIIIDGIIYVVETIVTTLLDNLPQIIEQGGQILMGIIQGIMDRLPDLINTAADLIIQIVTTLIKNLPQILAQGAEIITTIIKGIIGAIPTLVARIPEIIVAIVTTLVQNLPQILAQGGEILIALITGLIEAIPQLILAIPEIIKSIVQTFAEYDWATIGHEIMEGIKNGILKGWERVKEAVTDVADKVKNKFKDIFGIESPSKWMRDNIGKNLDAGLAVGLDQYKRIAIDAANGVSGAVANAFGTSLGADYGTSGRSANLYMTAPVYLDGQQIAVVVNNRLGVML